MTGLKRGTVKLFAHRKEWEQEAQSTIALLEKILKTSAVDIQHIGSTAICSICAKPIIDIAIGVRDLNDIENYIEPLEQNGIVFRGSDRPGQILFVIGSFENDTRTHHIHVVKWGCEDWNNYINFRDYLNAFPERAACYNECKQSLAKKFPNDRIGYTQGKQELINTLLKEADTWKKSR